MSIVHVAVGVILDAQGKVLLSRRHVDSHQGGLWEFPGGKLEGGEKLTEALARELDEELGIQPQRTEPLIEVRHDYGDKQVLLDTWLVLDFSGEPRGREQQPLAWVAADDLGDYAFPAANLPIVEALQDYLSR